MTHQGEVEGRKHSQGERQSEGLGCTSRRCLYLEQFLERESLLGGTDELELPNEEIGRVR
jgi:hypothetical protein